MLSARLLESKAHLIPGKLKVAELVFEVPKDYSNPSKGKLKIFARSVCKHEVPVTPLSASEAAKASQKPWMVYLQGGPGMGCGPPQSFPITQTILDKGYQMLFIDQRGTGLSSTITAKTLARQGDEKAQAEYLTFFRADNIVRDLETIRKTLTEDYPPELKKWSIIGQSFGGFCSFTYLSFAPQGLREVFTLGGVAPIGKTADEVYKATFQKVTERNDAYYAKYPEDIATVQDIVIHINNFGPIALPSGGKLTVRRFLSIGIVFGFHGGLDMVHELVLRMRLDIETFQELTRPTLSAFEHLAGFDDSIIYAVLHEPLYCGPGQASAWAAQRVGSKMPNFQWLNDKLEDETIRAQPLHFAGEMVFPFMFEGCFDELKGLRKVADILAAKKDWKQLYDTAKLLENEVPLYAATYVHDMYVDYDLAQETIKMVKGAKQYITNVMYHDAVRSRMDDIIRELFALRDDQID